MKRSVIGILAHVDAGKTTLSEAMLYCAGAIRTLGRVDRGNAFLDNFALERSRGITIFSKQALLRFPELQITLLDTPGHTDFSAETERTLDVLDCAILVISAPAGVQSHTRTLWQLLRSRGIPTFLFINKTDLPCPDRASILLTLSRELGDGFFDFAQPDREMLALCDGALLEELSETGSLSEASVADAIKRSTVFPCWFGAALRLEGVDRFLTDLRRLCPVCTPKQAFSAKVFKITRDGQNARMTHMKITGGSLRVRDLIKGDGWEEKATQLRLYSGAKFTAAEEAFPGDIVAVTGLSFTRPGTPLGGEAPGTPAQSEPVLTYRILLPQGYDIHKAAAQLRLLEEEEPELHLFWDRQNQQMQVSLMGPVQLEILQERLADRFGLPVEFGPGRILYKETIESVAEGVGHYEPLRHYAEVHLLLEPGEPGSGIKIGTRCSEDALDRNWQHLILTHLAEKQHLGVLTGAPITDIRITLVSGKAHPKHTEGGDFRQATYRAVRQGLMQAKSVLLEPWYTFSLTLPQENSGRAITDLQRKGAQTEPPETTENGTVLLRGRAPVAAMRDYAAELTAYTHGLGKLSCTFGGYAPCREQEKITEEAHYNPEADPENSPDSIFCRHGAGYPVKWSEVYGAMHLPLFLSSGPDRTDAAPGPKTEKKQAGRSPSAALEEELMAIFERTYGPVRRRTPSPREKEEKPAAPAQRPGSPRPRAVREKDETEFVLVDGYNVIFAWEDLRKLACDSLDAARARLISRLQNYQAARACEVIVVFDAYRVAGNPGSVEKNGGFSVVYTREAETADMYIEKATYDLSRKHFVRVVTSDYLEQIIIIGHGAFRESASSFLDEVTETEREIRRFLADPGD